MKRLFAWLLLPAAVSVCLVIVLAPAPVAVKGAAVDIRTPLATGFQGEGSSRKASSPRLNLTRGKQLFLKFRIPAGWNGNRTVLRLSPLNSGSRRLTIRRTRVNWRAGAPTGDSVISLLGPVRSGTLSAGVRTDIDLSSIISPGQTQTLRLEYTGRSRIGLGRIPYLMTQGGVEKTVSAVGDIACSPESSQWNGGSGTPTACRQDDVAGLTSRNDDAVLLLGDIQYPAGTLSQFKKGFGSSWGHLGTRLKPVPGNHEYYTPGAAGYFRYFRDLGVQTGRSRGGYYSFPLGAWTVLALNSNCSRVSCEAGSRQERWFRKRLRAAASTGRCTLAFWHHAPASSGWHGSQARLADLWRTFVELGGDLLLTGHDHHYERFEPMGPGLRPDPTGSPAWVIGTGGKSLRSAAKGDQRSAVVIDDTFGLTRFRLLSESFTWQWVGIGGVGDDSGSARCRG